MPLHYGQVKYLRKVAENNLLKNKKYRKFILTPCNRFGKSTMVAVLQLWYLFHKFGLTPGNREAWAKTEYRTANIAPAYALTEPVFKYIDQIMTSRFPINLPDGRLITNKCQIEWFYLADKTTHTPPRLQYFANNSYIEHKTMGSDSGDSLQGKPYGIITYDEGGRSSHLEEEISGNIMPRLFDWNGDLHVPSTPDQYSVSLLTHYEMYQDGLHDRNQTYTQEGSLKENTFFTPEQIKQQYRLYKNDPMAPQILEGKFVFGGDNIFNANDIMDAEDESLNDGVRRQPNHKYVIGIDTAISSDEMVYSVLDFTEEPFRLVRMMACKGNSKSPQMHLNDLIDLFHSYKDPEKANIWILLETWNGESARFYMDMPYELQAVTTCYGSWQPTKTTVTDNKNKAPNSTKNVKKADMIVVLKKLLSEKRLKIPKNNIKLSQQLSIYKENDDRITTDRTISLALAAWMAENKKFKVVNKWKPITW